MWSSFTLCMGTVALARLILADDTQFWHERYHGLLSMAAYGDYDTLCQETFTQETLLASFPDSTEEPWTLLSEWGPTASGLEGFNVMIPEMDKIVMVFKGLYGWEQLSVFHDTYIMATTDATLMAQQYDSGVCINNSFHSVSVLNVDCANCTAHAGALAGNSFPQIAYLEAKEATDDWAIVKQYVNSTGHQWSLTGHGFGGMVAQVAALDLGWRGLSHWSHNHGSARVFNPAAASLYNSLYAGEASQRVVANNDSAPTTIPESDDYTFVLEGFHIYGTNITYGMNYDVCVNDVTNVECLGGNNITDHDFSSAPFIPTDCCSFPADYTPIGFCGGKNVSYAYSEQAAFESSESSSFYATATLTFIPVTPSSTSTSIPSSSLASTLGAASTASGSLSSAKASSTGTDASKASTGGVAALQVGRAGAALSLVAGFVFLFL
ncbi:hypothetical protein P7C70_g4504, partial [Phenoliferia sp. Uapishka_3]